MSVGTYEIGGIQQVPQEQIDAIISGDVPQSVAEIDAVGMYANEFVPQWPGLNKIEEPTVYLRRSADGPRALTPERYAFVKDLGSRDTWRDELSLVSQIDEVERMERAQAEAARVRDLLDGRRALRLTPLTETVLTQATVTLPTITPRATSRTTEVRSHRAGYEHRGRGIVSRALGYLAGKFDDLLGAAKFA